MLKDKINSILTKNNKNNLNCLKFYWFESVLGPMLSIADENQLYLLEFLERKGLEKEIENLKIKTNSSIISGNNIIINSINKEIDMYFEGKLKEFSTPTLMIGTDFQKRTWQALMRIPYGQTISYSQLATNIGNPLAFRAAANANGMNPLAIIVPCHRVINSNGAIGGYGGGIPRKKFMINLEKSF
jgi:AraC family transcriptional regulator of adaptative response/methylated-DNA-[protein]-cysteine methyltransferase